MKFVVDANIILSALISDSMTRRLLVELEDDLLTPAYVHDELEKYTEMVAEKSGLSPAEVEDLIEILFKRIDVVPRSEVLTSLQEAARIMRDTDPDDAVYLASALERDAQVWSDDGDYDEQDIVSVATTGDIVERFEQQQTSRR
ncbi:PIN domain-containing protein [Haloarcula sp. Atlit-7R]|uniref:PIN domain-containing protein n=1 Tax=Haloarcula sp. Atlit-7R TaxID=2282125 RepID=UPI000EF13FBE|nr:PIN domain-containing protein [Haloarcula sp. Atlit-7R]RLM89527.1 PIN domain-containing protein [Haloarcula sp. Atlit-7R]